MDNPCEKVEGGVIYSLGKLSNGKLLYDFDKILIYLSAKGKICFGEHFRIYEEDHAILYKLVNYFIHNKSYCHEANIDLNKGILLAGPVGCGKTSLMKLLRHLIPGGRPFEVISARNVIYAYNHLGTQVIQDYGDAKTWCFDDLGVESLGRFYGRNCNVLGEVMLSRYDLFIRSKRKIKTYATTNQSAEELEERYGHRVRSRMRELFNLIAFDSNAMDKRV